MENPGISSASPSSNASPYISFQADVHSTVRKSQRSSYRSSSSTIQSFPVYPSNPAFNDDKADVILRSSDKVDFRVMKCILSLSSPFFRDMFSLPQPRSQDSITCEDIPVIPLEEDAQAVDTILCILYPTSSPIGERLGLGSINTIARAAEKYEMEKVTDYVRERLRGLLLKLDDTISDSGMTVLSVYALSCMYNFRSEALLAAEAFTKVREAHHLIPELDFISASYYDRLLRHRKRVTDAVLGVFLQPNFYTKAFVKHFHIPEHSCKEYRNLPEAFLEGNINMLIPGSPNFWTNMSSHTCIEERIKFITCLTCKNAARVGNSISTFHHNHHRRFEVQSHLCFQYLGLPTTLHWRTISKLKIKPLDESIFSLSNVMNCGYPNVITCPTCMAAICESWPRFQADVCQMQCSAARNVKLEYA